MTSLVARGERDFADAAPARESPDYGAATGPAMLFVCDAHGRMLKASDAWLAKLGFPRGEVVGQPFAGFLAAPSREVFHDVLTRGRCENVELPLVRRDGRVIDTLLSARSRGGPEDAGRLLLGAVADVTLLKEALRRSEASEAFYRALVEDQSDMVSLVTPEGELIFVNEAHARAFGREPRDFPGRSVFDFVPAEARPGLAAHLRRVAEGGGAEETENEIILPDGTPRWTAWRNRAVVEAISGRTLIHGVGRDIARRVAAEQQLKDSEARYRLLADNSRDMVMQLDTSLVRRYVSPASREIFGVEPEDMVGSAAGELVHPEDAPGLLRSLRSLLAGESEYDSVACRRKHRDGRWVWVETQYRSLKDPATGAVTGVIGAVRDISARKAIEEQLAEANRRLALQAAQDGLTGLANRRAFDDAYASAFRRSRVERKSLGLLMIDVDWFKPYNDRYGHPAGDECLRRIGQAILTATRSPEDLVARYGGEEFAVLLPNADEPAAASIAERVRQMVLRLEIAHEASAHRVVTVSLGVASVDAEADDIAPEPLLELADRALYRAKASGRNGYARASNLAADVPAPRRMRR